MPGRLNVRNISFSYAGTGAAGTLPVIADVSFETQAGELLAIVGPSGCGKTTLLHLIAAFLPRQVGAIYLDGIAVEKPAVDRVLLSQEQSLFPWKTVLQNVVFGMKTTHVPAGERHPRALSWLAMVGLADFADSYPHQLSGGMKQRAALARALAVRPTVLLLDEPFAALDWQSRQRLQEELLRVWSSTQPTIVLVTHDIDEAIFVADRVLVFSGRPARINSIIAVDLCRPRSTDQRLSPGFLLLKRRILGLLQEL